MTTSGSIGDVMTEEVFVPEDLVTAAEVAWGRYVSTVCLGGTPEQRLWAYALARKKQDAVWAWQRLHGKQHVAAA
jgi:hypothetical protein